MTCYLKNKYLVLPQMGIFGGDVHRHFYFILSAHFFLVELLDTASRSEGVPFGFNPRRNFSQPLTLYYAYFSYRNKDEY